MSQNSYTEHPVNWQGIAITVRYCRNWFSAFENVHHIEVVAENKEPLPITESGYRSRVTSQRKSTSLGLMAQPWLALAYDRAGQSSDRHQRACMPDAVRYHDLAALGVLH